MTPGVSCRTSSDGEAHVCKAAAAAAPLETGGAGSPFSPLAGTAFNESPATYSLAGGAALVVRFGLREVSGLGLHHVQPNVHHDPATKSACVFTGASERGEELW